MSVKTVTCMAFAAACLSSVAAIPAAQAQTMGPAPTPNYYGPQTYYYGNAYPYPITGPYGYGPGPGNYAPQSYAPQNYAGRAFNATQSGTFAYGAPNYYQGNTYPNAATGIYGTNTGNYAPQNYQSSTSPNWSSGTYSPQSHGEPSYGSTMPTYGQAGVGTYPTPGGTELVTNGPQGSPPANWSPAQNVRESEQYTRLLEQNRAFREARERTECGPITDPQLHQQCLASFGEYSPAAGSASIYGSSTTNEGYGSYQGR
jgi:hypothetical protein